jgi:hypothetical protein
MSTVSRLFDLSLIFFKPNTACYFDLSQGNGTCFTRGYPDSHRTIHYLCDNRDVGNYQTRATIQFQDIHGGWLSSDSRCSRYSSNSDMELFRRHKQRTIKCRQGCDCRFDLRDRITFATVILLEPTPSTIPFNTSSPTPIHQSCTSRTTPRACRCGGLYSPKALEEEEICDYSA